MADRPIQLKPDWLTCEFLCKAITKGKLDDILNKQILGDTLKSE